MDVSIVVPLFNEDESLPELCSWITRVVTESNLSYEVLLIDDGSTDNSWKVIESIAAENNAFKGIRFRRNYGKSAALNEGFKAAEGDVVITMDADMQDSPDEIPALRKMIIEDGFDMVSGWKKIRYDNTLTKNIPSKLFNAVARKSSGIQLNDFTSIDQLKREINNYKGYLVGLDNNPSLKTMSNSDLYNIRDEILADLNQFLYLLTFNK